MSRSKIDLFVHCPRCLYLELRHGIKRPDSYPLTLNIAVDALLKKEFDTYRAQGQPHPMMTACGVEAIPFKDPHMDVWRELDYGRGGIHILHHESRFDVYGVVDDIWVNPQGQLLVVDYKATAKSSPPTLDGDLGVQYKRQMEVYQWLLRQNGYPVATTGYFFYVNGKKDLPRFDAKLEFAVTILPCEGDSSWIEPTLLAIRASLENPLIPAASPDCDYCLYRTAAASLETTNLPIRPPQPPVVVPSQPIAQASASTAQNPTSLKKSTQLQAL